MADLARDMTEAIRRPGGTMSLRPMQAFALFELGTLGGLFGPMRVGVGKTLVSLLAPYVTEARRPLLLLPAKLVEKTIRERKELSRHWPVPVHLRIVSYELLGGTQSAALLENYAPDLIIADEAHKLKNTKASVTRRVSRYMKTHPDTPFAALSGTITKRSLKDYAHVVHWCLPSQFSPIPNSWTELEEWADALDEKRAETRTDPGALLLFCNQEEKALAQEDRRERAHDLLAAVGVEGREGHKPRQLSGGEQQRVAVARALVNEPLVLLADEPSGNLDGATSEPLHELLFRLREERALSMVIVTHNPDLARRAGRRLLMADGRLHDRFEG